MRGGNQPSEAVHSILSIWSIASQYKLRDSNLSSSPVNALPKTNSFGGVSSFGEVVFLIDNLEGSISWGLIVDAASA